MAGKSRASSTINATDEERNTPPTLTPVPASLAEAADENAARAWFEDKVVRAVREQGHCQEALIILDKVFGRPLDKVGVYDTRGSYGSGNGSSYREGKLYPAYLDSDGYDCWNDTWRDKDGYDRHGFNKDGRDKDGFNKDGFDEDGFNREGKDANGVSRDDPARFVYDARGYDKEGYNRQGYNRQGWNREGKNAYGQTLPETPFVFDSFGRDKDGYNADGYNAQGEYNPEKAREYVSARESARMRLR